MEVGANVVRGPKDASLFTRRFVLLLVTQTLFGLSFSTFFLLPKFLKLVLHASEVELGKVGAFGTVAGVLAFPLVGALNDRFGRRPFVLLGTFMLTCSAFAMLLVGETGPLLYGLRVLHGLSFALLFNSATTLVSDGVQGERMGQALSIFGASLLATQALAPAFAEAIAARAGWPWVFAASGTCGALSLLSALFVHDVNGQHVRTVAGGGHAFFQLLRRPDVRRVVYVIAVSGAGFGTVFTFHQPFALARGIERVSGFFMAYALAAVLTRLGFVLRIAPEKRLRAVTVGVFSYAIAVALTAAISPSMLVVVGAVMGLAQGVFYPLYNAAALERVTLSQRGSMMALYHGGFNLGISLALVAGGPFATHFGFPALFLSIAVVVCTGGVILLRREIAYGQGRVYDSEGH
jgi:MFS family permease